MKHELPEIDLSDGESQAYVNDATRFLLGAAERAMMISDPGDGGEADQALGLIGLLADALEEDAEAYVLALFSAAAKRLVDGPLSHVV